MVREPNGNGTLKLMTTVCTKFQQSDDGKKLQCIIQPQHGRGDTVTIDRRIFGDCKSLINFFIDLICLSNL